MQHCCRGGVGRDVVAALAAARPLQFIVSVQPGSLSRRPARAIRPLAIDLVPAGSMIFELSASP